MRIVLPTAEDRAKISALVAATVVSVGSGR
jgi:hypothetical protein